MENYEESESLANLEDLEYESMLYRLGHVFDMARMEHRELLSLRREVSDLRRERADMINEVLKSGHISAGAVFRASIAGVLIAQGKPPLSEKDKVNMARLAGVKDAD